MIRIYQKEDAEYQKSKDIKFSEEISIKIKKQFSIPLNKKIILYCPTHRDNINDYNLNIIGLMCLPPQNKKPTDYFLLLKKLAKALSISELSMGMSNDFEEAIQCGSTYIRIGSNIFGKRI